MKKTLLVLSLVAIGLSGCYVRGHDEGHRRDRDHHDARNDKKGHDDHRDNRNNDRKSDRGEERSDRDR